MWEPALAVHPNVSRVLRGELGRGSDGVTVVVALPDGRVVSGGYEGRVLVWDRVGETVCATIAGPARAVAVAAGPRGHKTSAIVVANRDTGLSYWSIADDPGRPAG